MRLLAGPDPVSYSWFLTARSQRAMGSASGSGTRSDPVERAQPCLPASQPEAPGAVDACFHTDGSEIASGDHVWDGILDDLPPGPCTQYFPLHQTTRIVAGGPIQGGIFKCALQSVDHAIADGDYGSWTPSAAERARLMEIFPEGVCDWSRPDQGRPRSNPLHPHHHWGGWWGKLL